MPIDISKVVIMMIMSNDLGDRLVHNLLLEEGYYIKEVEIEQLTSSSASEIIDLVIVGKNIHNQSDLCLSSLHIHAKEGNCGCEVDRFFQKLKSAYGENADIPIVYLKNYQFYSEASDSNSIEVSKFLGEVKDRVTFISKIRELKQQNLELENQLQKTQDACSNAIKAKNDFLTRTSHELRSPLNAIIGFSQLMCWDKLLAAEQRGYTEIIYDSGKHLLSLVNDVLEMSKLQSHQMEVDKKYFVLREMINDLKYIFTPKAEKKNLKLEVKIGEEVPVCIQSDEFKLRQVLVNVLNNAINSTQDGSISLQILLTSDILTHSLHLSFEVQDSSSGMTHSEVDTIFEPFGQNCRGEGTGLGLSISRQFTTLLGGELNVKSELGEGTTFILSIPVEMPISYVGDRLKNFESEKPKSNLSILLAEDNIVDQKLLVRVLQQMGYAVDVARDGLEVLTALACKPYDLILMDVQMPNMNGIETTKQIIKRLGNVNAPVIIALTGGGMPEDQRQCLNAGMADFLTKPVRPKQLKAVLSHWEQKLVRV